LGKSEKVAHRLNRIPLAKAILTTGNNGYYFKSGNLLKKIEEYRHNRVPSLDSS
jgi:hypothetical protein